MGIKGQRRFTQEDYDYIKEWHSKITIKEIASNLKRTPKTIQNKIHQLGIAKVKHNPPWSNEEIQTLKDLLDTHSKQEISNKLKRSVGAVGCQLQKLGLKAKILPLRTGRTKPWTKKEEDMVLFLAGRMPLKYAARRIGRSVKAIEEKCRKLNIVWRGGTITIQEITRVTKLSESTIHFHMRKLRLKTGQTYFTEPEIFSKIATSVLDNNRSLGRCGPSIKHLESIERGDFDYANVAQKVEQFTCNEHAGGSIPLVGSNMARWETESV